MEKFVHYWKTNKKSKTNKRIYDHH